MFILPGLLALVVFIYARPFDFLPALRNWPFLYLFCALAAVGFLVDLGQGKSRPRASSQFLRVGAFYVWCILTAGIAAPDSLANFGLKLTIALVIYALIALGISSVNAFEALAATILACTLFISAVCVHQGLQPLQCIAVTDLGTHTELERPDGRLCESVQVCVEEAPDPDADYRCEHVGLLGITSVGAGRVRYVGVLQDPNEISLTVALSIPLAFALFQCKRTALRFVTAAATLLLSTVVVVMSESRGGQLVFLSVLGVYWVKRYRMKGFLIAALAAIPVLLLGGRQDSGPDSSTMERLDNLQVGVQLFFRRPVLGVGFGQFTEHHHLTAHNSYVLAAAELGLPGMVLWLSILFGNLKVPWVATSRVEVPDGDHARIWGLALLAALTGLSVGIFFLSFNYHFVFWIYMGMASAFAAFVRRRLPDSRTQVTLKEMGLLAIGGAALLVLIYLYATFKLRSG
jgi:hypothetical protein